MARDRFPRRAQRASITLVALCISAAIGIALGSYIALCSQSMKLSARSAQREKASELAQTGLEEALWALNQNTWNSSGPDGSATWTTAGANRTATISYPMTGQGMTGQAVITIANYASTVPPWPTITVNSTVTLNSGESFTNSVQATTQPAPLFGNAIASAEADVSFASGGTIDSWNSDPDNNPATAMVPYSFTTGNATNYNAVVAGCTNGSASGVEITNAKILGYVATSGLPVSYAANGKILGPSTAADVLVDTARIGKSAFVPLTSVFSTTLPTVTVGGGGGLLGAITDLLNALLSLPASGGTIKYSGNLTLDGSNLLGLLMSTLTIDKPTKIIVDGDLNVTSKTVFLLGTTYGNITVKPTGSLELYVTGDITIGGQGMINQTNDPKKMAIFSTDTSTATAITFNTTQSFCGVVFSENKPINIRQNTTFYGALLSRQSVKFSDTSPTPLNFHYDLALRQTRFGAVTTPYLIGQVTKL